MNYWLWLASIEDLSSTHKLKLLEELKTPENIYKALDGHQIGTFFVSKKTN